MFQRSFMLIVLLAAVVVARGGTPQFRAIEVHQRLYETSYTAPVFLNDAGQMIVEEQNSETGHGRAIDYRIYTPEDGSSRRLDDVLGVPSRQMPAGPVATSRPRALTDAGRIIAVAPNVLYEPVGTALTATPLESTIINDRRHRPQVDLNQPHRLALRVHAGPSVAGSEITSIVVPGVGADDFVFPAQINSRSSVAGLFNTDANRTIPFLWYPDLSGQTQGQFIDLGLTTNQRIDGEVSMLLTNTDTVVINRFMGSQLTYSAHLWKDGGLINLQQFFGREAVQVIDINDAGSMIVQLSDADGANRNVYYYTETEGVRLFDRSWIDVPLGDEFLGFKPMWLNDSGQIAGMASYRQLLPNGSSLLLGKAVLLSPVPEPGLVAAMAMLCGVMSCRRRA
jgi:hypothetical protein